MVAEQTQPTSRWLRRLIIKFIPNGLLSSFCSNLHFRSLKTVQSVQAACTVYGSSLSLLYLNPHHHFRVEQKSWCLTKAWLEAGRRGRRKRIQFSLRRRSSLNSSKHKRMQEWNRTNHLFSTMMSDLAIIKYMAIITLFSWSAPLSGMSRRVWSLLSPPSRSPSFLDRRLFLGWLQIQPLSFFPPWESLRPGGGFDAEVFLAPAPPPPSPGCTPWSVARAGRQERELQAEASPILSQRGLSLPSLQCECGFCPPGHIFPTDCCWLTW